MRVSTSAAGSAYKDTEVYLSKRDADDTASPIHLMIFTLTVAAVITSVGGNYTVSFWCAFGALAFLYAST